MIRAFLYLFPETSRVSIPKFLYALALVLMPMTYAVKFIIGTPDMTWIDPTLILALLLFILCASCISRSFLDRPILSFIIGSIIVSTLLSALVGYLLNSQVDSTYAVLREPIRLILNIVWFAVSIHLIEADTSFVLRWLSISVVLQLAIAVVLITAASGLLPLPEAVNTYAMDYFFRQCLWFGGVPIPRFGGTFFEAPPFGLFMFSAAMIFTLSRSAPKWGLRLSWLGMFISLSDQVFTGLAVTVILSVWHFIKKKRTKRAILIVLLLLLAFPYILFRLTSKSNEVTITESGEVYGTSGGERSFHAHYAAQILIGNTTGLLFGIGPGRYGDYASRTGIFPATVTPQFTLVEWIVEYGFLGTGCFVAFIFVVAYESFHNYGTAGIAVLCGLIVANSFQANWKWEAWFLSLAFLCATPNLKTTSSENESGSEVLTCSPRVLSEKDLLSE